MRLPPTSWRPRLRRDPPTGSLVRCSRPQLLPEEVAGIVGRRHADVEQRQGAHGDGDATLGALTQVGVGGERSDDEGDQGDDDAEPGDEGKQRSGVIGQVNETFEHTRRQTTEVGPNRDVGDDGAHYLPPSPATPAFTTRQGWTSWRHAPTWSQRRSSS